MDVEKQTTPPLWRQKKLYLLLLVFWGFCLTYFSVGKLNTVTMTVTMSAEKGGLLTLYLPTFKNRFRESKKRSIHYKAGPNSLQLKQLPFSAGQHLRFDPDSQINTVQIHSIRLSKSGQTTTLQGQELADHFVNTTGLKWKSSPEALSLKLTNEDPQIVFGDLPVASLNLSLWFSPVPISILLTLLLYGINRLSPQWSGRSVSLAVITLLLMYWQGALPPGASVYRTLGVSGLAAWAITLSLWSLWENRRPQDRLGFGSSFVVIFSTGVIIVGLMLATLNPESRVKIATVTGEAFVEKQPEGQKAALENSRQALKKSFVRNFPLRKQLLTLNSESKIFGMGFSPTPKVIIGKDDWFFEGYGKRRVEGDVVRSFDNITDYMGRNPFSEAELEAWRVALEERYYWLKEKGSSYIFALAPTKALIYPEKLPDRILEMKQRANRPTRYDQLISYLQEKSVVPVVDLRRALLEEKKRAGETPLFYRTDFHWNYYGSLSAYQAIIDTINTAYPKYSLNNARLDEFTIKKRTDWVHIRFMSMVGLDPMRQRNETYLTFFPNSGSPYEEIHHFGKKGISDYSLPGPERNEEARMSFRTIDNPGGQVGLIFVIGDSFIEKTLGYFSLNAQRVMNYRVVTNFPTEPFTKLGLRPDIVIQEVLNMYLLQRPPSNPPHVQRARTRALTTAAN
ncbi:MAG: hypothetical protein ABFS19_07655 [Thermodesulfobacteriota bacterium]